MIRNRLGPLLLFALTGCAAGTDQYPSLAIRDVERVTGTAQPVAPYVPSPPPPATLDRLETLVAEAAAAHQSFLAAAPEARRVVNAASGASVGSEAWSAAQVALATLETDRSRVAVPLVELEQLYVEAAVEGLALERIAAAREEVTEMAEVESQTITTLMAVLR